MTRFGTRLLTAAIIGALAAAFAARHFPNAGLRPLTAVAALIALMVLAMAYLADGRNR